MAAGAICLKQQSSMPNDATSTSSSPPDTPEDGKMLFPEPRPASDIMEDEFERALREISGEEPAVAQALTVATTKEVEDPNGTYITEEIGIKIRNMLGIKQASWDRIMPQVRGELVPKYALHKIAARVSLNMGFENIGQLSQAVEIGKGIMENEKVDAHTRVAAGKMISNAVEAMGKMFPELLRLADAGGDRTAADDKLAGAGSNRPKNLPPMLNVQVNVSGNGGPSTSPGGSPTYPMRAVVKSGNGRA